MSDKKLAIILRTAGVLSDSAARRAQRRALCRGTSLIHQLDVLGYLTQQETAQVLAQALELEQVDLGAAECPPQLSELVPMDIALKWSVVPAIKDDTLVLACSNPTDCGCFDALEELLNSPKTYVAIATEKQIHARFRRVYDSPVPSSPGLYEALLSAAGPADDRVDALIDALLTDVSEVEGDLHVLPDNDGYRAGLCLSEGLDELCSMSPQIYTALEFKLRSKIGPSTQHGEFVATGVNQGVRFLVDFERGHSGRQIFISFVDRATTPTPSDSRVSVEMSVSMFQGLEAAAASQRTTISELIERGWAMSSEDISTPCVCPYMAPSATRMIVELDLNPQTLGNMQVAARELGRPLDWVLSKVYMMTGECLRNAG